MKKPLFFLMCSIMMSAALFLGSCSKKVTKVETPQPAVKQAPPDTAQPKERESFERIPTDEELRAILQPVYFDFDKSVLRQDALERLQLIGQLLKDRPSISIVVEGNCDERGSAEYNMALGERRARAAKDWLTGYGIADNRVEINSYGKERPAIANCTDQQCHAKNRRDEFNVLAK